MLRFLYFLSIMLLTQSLFAQNAVAFLSDLATSARVNYTATPPAKAPAIVYIPFTLEGGMIFVEAELEGKRGSFILDTGAPGLVINSLEVEENTDEELMGIQGAVGVEEGKVASFAWAGVQYQEVSVLNIDISHFERLTGRKIHGLIGYEFLQDRELFIDFDNGMISLRRVRKLNAAEKRPQEVSFSSLAHLPVVKMQLNGKTGYFGLDTGSEINILDSRWKKRIKSRMIQKNQIMGVGGKVKKVKKASVSNSQIGEVEIANMEYHFVDLSEIERAHGVRLDGILGFPFFSTHQVSLSFSDQKLCFW